VLARRIGKGGNGAGMAVCEGHPHVDHVGDCQVGFFTGVLIEHRMGNRFQSKDGRAVDGTVQSLEQLVAALARKRSAKAGS
jgi:hypothetical protein